MTIRPFLAAVLLSGAVASPMTSSAATRSWGAAQSGSFDGSDHQWNVIPGVNDIARFHSYTADSAFTVTLTRDVSNQYIRVDGEHPFEVTLDLAGHVYTASLDGSVVGRDAGNTENTLRLTGGGSFNAQAFTVGNAAGSSGKLILTGATAFETAGEMLVGAYGSGALEITGGAHYTSKENVRVGRRATGVGSVLVSGSNSRWEAQRELFFGSQLSGAKGTLTIEAGGKVETTSVGTDGAISFAQVAGATAEALITGAGSELSSGSTLAIGGSRSGVGGSAEVTVANGGLMKVGSTLLIYSGGTLNLDGGVATARSIGGSDAAVAGTIQLTLQASSASIASLRASQDLYFDTSSATLTLSLADGVSFAEEEVIRLIDYRGTLTGSFSNYSEGQIVTLGDAQFSFSYTMGEEGNRYIGLAAIPEPNSVAFLLLGGLLAGVAGMKGWRKG